MKNGRDILLVEDDTVDHMLVRRALAELRIPNRLEIAASGEKALSYLRDETNPRPGIIVLDLNMPRLTGIEFLRILKADERLKVIPVVILTTSQEEQEKLESYRLGIAGYMVKPMEYSAFVELIRTVSAYWSLSELAT